MLLLLVALAWLQLVDSVAAAVVYAVMLGSSGAVSQAISGAIWAHFYGRVRGRIQRSGMMIGITGAAIGPLPLALLEDAFGAFGPGQAVIMALPALSIVVISLAHPAVHEGEQAEGVAA